MMNEEQLKELLEVNDQGYIKRRESSVLEFKANFHPRLLHRYAKTMAAFANNKGGILIFGVTDNPRYRKGMTNNNFIELAPEMITGELNRIFQPEIQWSINDVSIEGCVFGFIIVREAMSKPVIAVSNKADSIKEGAIYYRYNARNELIKYAEMVAIINSIKTREHKLWLNHLKQIAHIGPEQSGIFNPKDGLVKGPSGAFIIDRSLLPSLQFIREGEFVEKDGAPTIKLIGNVQVIGSNEGDYQGLIGIQEKAINQTDIIVNFLNRVQVRSPIEYLKQICLERTKYLPFYYYLKLANMELDKLEDLLTEIHGYKSLLDRERTDEYRLPTSLRNTGSNACKRKNEIQQLLLNEKFNIPEDKKELQYLLFVLRSINDKELIRKILLKINTLPLRQLNIILEFRKTVCYLDFIENTPDQIILRKRSLRQRNLS